MAENSSTIARPRARRLQFSLRLLLLAFTAFALGFPIWYRWPYEETVFESPAGLLRRITTWQRQWGGGRLKHGIERLVSSGKTVESVTYRNGLRHGPYESKNHRGQFVDDLKEGVWTGPDRTSTWRRGKLHGSYEIRLPGPQFHYRPFNYWDRDDLDEPRTFHLIFTDGRLTQFNGKPASGRLFDLLETDVIDSRIRSELGKLTQLDVVEMPLKDIVLYLTEMHQIPIAIDPVLAPHADMPITDEFRGVDLSSVLTLITAPRGLGCDYRYGSLWITTADDTNDWHDPTGVSDVKPPAESALARAWNEPTKIDANNVQLSSVLNDLQQRLAIQIDTAHIQYTIEKPVSLPVTHSISAAFHHLLGQLLYKTRCRCRLDGETLFILPPENEPTQ